MKKPIIFTTLAYKKLTSEFSPKKGSRFQIGKLERKIFPDGERYTRILDNVQNKHVVIIGATKTDSELMEIYELASAVVKYGANKLTLIIPYFGYSTMERMVNKGEVVGAKVRARLLSSLPQASEGNKICLLDLHSEGIPYYFENNTTVFHVYAKSIIHKMIKTHAPQNAELVLGSTDAGRAKWVESLARDLNIQPAFIYKQRTGGSETHITGVNANVKGKHVIVYDDMIRSGGSMIQACKAYKDAGAKSIGIVCTHGVFCEKSSPVESKANMAGVKGVIDNIIKESGALYLCTTDSYIHNEDLNHTQRFYIYPMINLFFNYIIDEES